MANATRRPGGRPQVLPATSRKVYVKLPPPLDQKIRAMALEEKRTLSAQIQFLLERGLRSYGLELSA